MRKKLCQWERAEVVAIIDSLGTIGHIKRIRNFHTLLTTGFRPRKNADVVLIGQRSLFNPQIPGKSCKNRLSLKAFFGKSGAYFLRKTAAKILTQGGKSLIISLIAMLRLGKRCMFFKMYSIMKRMNSLAVYPHAKEDCAGAVTETI